jgi:hypothetical protein
MLGRRVLPLLACVALACRCLPGPLDLTGKACSSDHPCGSGFYCAQTSLAVPNGYCEAGDPPPPVNLLANPSFEEAAPDGGATLPHWRVTGQGRLTRDFLITYDGTVSALVSSTYDGGSTEPRLTADNVLDAGQYELCATIQVYAVQAEASTRVSISLSARYDGGAFTQSGNSSTLEPVSQWTLLSANMDTSQFGISPDDVSFSVGTSGFPLSQELVFDDAWLWHPYDGQCP